MTSWHKITIVNTRAVFLLESLESVALRVYGFFLLRFDTTVIVPPSEILKRKRFNLILLELKLYMKCLREKVFNKNSSNTTVELRE